MAKKKYYEHKITLGKTITGETIRKSFYSSKSKSDAKRKAEKYRAAYELELLCGGNEPVRHTLFSAWALECLELNVFISGTKPFDPAFWEYGAGCDPADPRPAVHQ